MTLEIWTRYHWVKFAVSDDRDYLLLLRSLLYEEFA